MLAKETNEGKMVGPMAPSAVMTLRLPTEIMDRLEAYVERLNELTPGLGANKVDAVRVLLTKALDAEGIKAQVKKSKR